MTLERLAGGDGRYDIHSLHLQSKTVQPDGRLCSAPGGCHRRCVHMWAQNIDTPIIIADGSLTMESRGVPWATTANSGGNTKVHPNGGKSSPRW